MLPPSVSNSFEGMEASRPRPVSISHVAAEYQYCSEIVATKLDVGGRTLTWEHLKKLLPILLLESYIPNFNSFGNSGSSMRVRMETRCSQKVDSRRPSLLLFATKPGSLKNNER